ncbi:unnamed protein product [Lampetra fluviatilis]
MASGRDQRRGGRQRRRRNSTIDRGDGAIKTVSCESAPDEARGTVRGSEIASTEQWPDGEPAMVLTSVGIAVACYPRSFSC